MSFVLYHYPMSYASQIVRLALAEKRVTDWVGRVVDVGPPHQNYEPWFMRLNPAGAVPVAEFDGEVVAGSIAICREVEARFPDRPLLPEDDAARAATERWIELHQAFPDMALTYARTSGVIGVLARQDLPARIRALERYRAANPDLAPAYDAKIAQFEELRRTLANPARVVELEQHVDGMLHALEAQLSANLWIGGPDYGLADVAWTALLARLEMLNMTALFAPRRAPATADWYVRVKSRPSFRAAPMFTRMSPWELAKGVARKARGALPG